MIDKYQEALNRINCLPHAKHSCLAYDIDTLRELLSNNEELKIENRKLKEQLRLAYTRLELHTGIPVDQWEEIISEF